MGNRRWRIAGTLAMLALVASAAWWVLRPPHSLSPDEAVRRYSEGTRHEGESGQAAESVGRTPKTSEQSLVRVPAEGVYSYATKGFERTDALTGSRHEYPKRTAITIRHTRCGILERWQPLDGRWDELDLCPTASRIDLAQVTTYREFFQLGERTFFSCDDRPPFYPGSSNEDRWTFECVSADTRFSATAAAEGSDTLQVGRASISTRHFRFRLTFSGKTRGSQVRDRWVETGTGLLVKEQSETDVATDTQVGTANYAESYSLHLVSIAPRA